MPALYANNAGCTVDGKDGAQVHIDDLQNAKVISPECYVVPKELANDAVVARTLYTSNPGCTIDGVAGSQADNQLILHGKVVSPECLVKPAP